MNTSSFLYDKQESVQSQLQIHLQPVTEGIGMPKIGNIDAQCPAAPLLNGSLNRCCHVARSVCPHLHRCILARSILPNGLQLIDVILSDIPLQPQPKFMLPRSPNNSRIDVLQEAVELNLRMVVSSSLENELPVIEGMDELDVGLLPLPVLDVVAVDDFETQVVLSEGGFVLDVTAVVHHRQPKVRRPVATLYGHAQLAAQSVQVALASDVSVPVELVVVAAEAAVVVVEFEGVPAEQTADGAALSEGQPHSELVKGADSAISLLEV